MIGPVAFFRFGDPCALCGVPISRDEEHWEFENCIPSWSSLVAISGRSAHAACYCAWPHAEAFERLHYAWELAQKAAYEKGLADFGYDFECACDEHDPVWPHARRDVLQARLAEHEARLSREWAGRNSTVPPPPGDRAEPTLASLRSTAAAFDHDHDRVSRRR